MYQPKFELSFIYNPKYWGIWFGVGLLKLISFLPYPTRYKLGGILGAMMRILASKRRRLVAANLALAFPDMPNSERKTLLKAHFEQLGITIIETTIVWWGDYQNNPESSIFQWVSYQGLEHLENAIACGKGVLIVAPHFTTLEMTGLFLSFKTGFNAVYRPHDNKLMDYLIAKGRAIPLKDGSHVNPIANRNTRGMVKVLKNGECMTILPDQRYRNKGKVIVPFMNTEASSNPATSKLAKMTGCKVIVCLTKRIKNQQYQIEFLPPLEDFPSNDPVQDTLKLHKLYEQAILQTPEQYLWVHNRWNLAWDKVNKQYLPKTR